MQLRDSHQLSRSYYHVIMRQHGSLRICPETLLGLHKIFRCFFLAWKKNGEQKPVIAASLLQLLRSAIYGE